MSTTFRREATFGPLTVTIDRQGVPATADPHAERLPAWATGSERGIVKLVARWGLTVSGEPVIGNSPYFYGSTRDEGEMAQAEDILDSVMLDLESVIDYLGGEPLEDFREWATEYSAAQDVGAFLDDLATYQELRTRAQLVAEALRDDHRDGQATLRATIEAWRDAGGDDR